MGVNNRNTEEKRNVSSINKDYVRSVERQEKREKAHKVRLFRRLGAFAVIVVMVMGWLTLTMFDKSQALAAKESEKAEVLQALEEVKEELKQQKEERKQENLR